MKFTTNEMKDAAKVVGMFVPSKSPLPSAECIYIEAQTDGVVWLRTSDPMGAAAALMIHARVEEPGAAFVTAKTLNAVLGKMGDEITVESDGKVCTITTGDTEVKMAVLSDDYKKPMHIDGKPVLISGQNFIDIVNGISFAAAADTSVHSGAKFEIYCGMLTAVCLDGFRMAVRSCAVDAPDGEFIIPVRLLADLARIVDDEVKIYYNDKAVRIQSGILNITVPQLKGDYLKWKNAIPGAEKTIVTAAKKDLIAKLDLLNAVNDGKKPVVMQFNDSVCELSVQTVMSAIRDKIGVKMQGDAVTIGFNPKFIYEAVKAADEEIEIHLNGAISPITIKGDGFLYLVLPVKVKE